MTNREATDGARGLLMAFRLAVPVALAVTLAGCGSFGAVGMPVFNRSAQQQPAVEPAPLPPVETAALPPPGGVQQQDPFMPSTGTPPAGGTFDSSGAVAGGQPQQQTIPGAQAPQQTALAQPQTSSNITPSSSGIGRTDLLGGWTITTAGDSCQLFMTLTSWTGGYRASTRGCNNDTLKSISAWNLQGNQVTLAGQGGKPVATLYPSGGGRFDGQTAGQGAAVSFYR